MRAQEAEEMTLLKDAYRAGGISTAAAAYEHVTRRTGRPDSVLLGQLADWTVAGLVADEDEMVRGAACAVTVPYSRDKACIAALQGVMGDANATFVVRLTAVNALRRAGDPYADKAVQMLATEAVAQNSIGAAPLLRESPPAVAVPLLRQMLAGENRQEQYVAAMVLAQVSGKPASAALAEHVDRLSGSARIVAVAALAADGHAAHHKSLNAAISQLDGLDLYFAAIALQRLGDPRGVKGLLQVLGGGDETLALEAASRLLDGPERIRARSAIRAAVASRNPLVRAQALKLWLDAGWPSDAEVRRRLADTDPWVRLQAAAVLAREAHAAAAVRQP